MIIVTGGAGFIGSNLVKALNERGRDNILVVDNLTNGAKYANLVDCEIQDFWDKEIFLAHVKGEQAFPEPVEAIFHQGACSATTEWNGRYMMQNNFDYSKGLLHYCLNREIPFINASSASVYGGGRVFQVDRAHEAPLNVYGYSKFLFDRYLRRVTRNASSQLVSLRYFNVYGPREQHKGSMASVAYHFNGQLLTDGHVRLFQGSDGYADGEQRRDFIYVGDAVAVNLWFFDHPDKSGIFNVGTGRSQTFNEVAQAVVDYHGRGSIEYIAFPEHLKGHYQSFTEADITGLREAGYDAAFKSVQEGVPLYMEWLSSRAK